jgi:hypothetical protein
MGTTTAATGTRPGQRSTAAVCVGLAVAGGILLSACGGGDAAAPATPTSAPASPTPTVDAASKPYCDTVTRVQAQQASPQAGKGGLTAASDQARRQVTDLVASAPPEIAGDWRAVQRLTEQALGSLAGTRGDPKKIDRDELAKLEQQSQPAVAHIKTVTEQRCHVVFRPTG